MKWTYEITTLSGRGGNEQQLGGVHYGTFGEAVGQVHRAVVFGGWDKNTSPVHITLKPDRS